MTSVDIEYCVPCGFLERAIDLQRSLLDQYGEGLDSVRLVTGDHGVFKVRVDGEVIFDKETDTYDQAAIANKVADYL